MYRKYILTPGYLSDSGGFFPKASPQDAREVAEDEGCGAAACGLMGFDSESGAWDVLLTSKEAEDVVRKVRMMFGEAPEWDGQAPMEFVRDGREERLRDEMRELYSLCDVLSSAVLASAAHLNDAIAEMKKRVWARLNPEKNVRQPR